MSDRPQIVLEPYEVCASVAELLPGFGGQTLEARHPNYF